MANYVFNIAKKGWVSGAAGANFPQWNTVAANKGFRLLYLTSSAAAILNAANAEDALTIADLTGLLSFEHPVNVSAPSAPADGYQTGGILLTGRTVNLDTALNRSELIANNITLAAVDPGGTITDFVLYYENDLAPPGAANVNTLQGIPVARYDISAAPVVGASTQLAVKWAGNTGSAGRVLRLG